MIMKIYEESEVVAPKARKVPKVMKYATDV
jgi:hypothetical protein